MIKQVLYGEVEVVRKPPLNILEIYGRENFIVSPEVIPSIVLCQIDNSFVSPYGVVFHKWKVVRESIYDMFVDNNHYPTFFKKILLGRIRRIEGVSILCHHHWFANYYHFTTECLPRLYLLREFSNEAKLLVHESFPKFALDYVKLLGFNNLVYVKDKEIVKSERLTFSSFVARNNSQHPEILPELVKEFKSKAVSAESIIEGYKNVYISRKKATSRKLINEEDIIELVKKYDFKVIYLEDYTVEEQIRLFSTVKNIVCVHGAGTTNIMYMQKGGLLIELINSTHHAPFFYNLANVFNHDTIYVQGIACPDTRNPIRDNFKIELHKLEFFLEKYLK